MKNGAPALSRTMRARWRQGRSIGFRAFAHPSSEFAFQTVRIKIKRRSNAGKIRASARQGRKSRALPALGWVSPGACAQDHCPHRMPPMSRARLSGGDPPSPALRRPSLAPANFASSTTVPAGLKTYPMVRFACPECGASERARGQSARCFCIKKLVPRQFCQGARAHEGVSGPVKVLGGPARAFGVLGRSSSIALKAARPSRQAETPVASASVRRVVVTQGS